MDHIKDLNIKNSQLIISAVLILSIEGFIKGLPYQKDKIINLSQNSEVRTVPIEDFYYNFKDYVYKIKEGNNLGERALELISDVQKHVELLNANNNFTSFIYQFIEIFKEYLTTLSLEQMAALIHTSASILILSCLSSIIGIFYVDSLIRKFNLEEKYSKVARFINIRRKLVLFLY